MLALLRDRDFARLWLAGAVSMTGDWVILVALPVQVYALTGSTLATGGSFAAYVLPRLLFGSFAGALVDRWDRRRTMVLSDLARAALTLPLLLVSSGDAVWVAYVVVFGHSAFGQLHAPAEAALLPRLVEHERLVPANALGQGTGGAIRLFGPALGGLLAGGVGFGAAVLVDAASFAAAALLVAGIRGGAVAEPAASASATAVGAREVGARPGAPAGRGPAWWMPAGWLSRVGQPALLRETLDGVRMVLRARVLSAVFLCDSLVALAYGFVYVLLVAFVSEALGGGAPEYALIAAAQGIGGVAGSLLIARLGAAAGPLRLFCVGLLAMGVAFVLAFRSSQLWLVVPFMALAGFAMVGWTVGARTLMQRAVPDAYRGRVLGAYATTGAALQIAGIGLASVLGDAVGVTTVLRAATAIYLLAALVALVGLRGVSDLTMD
jgi:MFS family permease